MDWLQSFKAPYHEQVNLSLDNPNTQNIKGWSSRFLIRGSALYYRSTGLRFEVMVQLKLLCKAKREGRQQEVLRRAREEES